MTGGRLRTYPAVGRRTTEENEPPAIYTAPSLADRLVRHQVRGRQGRAAHQRRQDQAGHGRPLAGLLARGVWHAPQPPGATQAIPAAISSPPAITASVAIAEPPPNRRPADRRAHAALLARPRSYRAGTQGQGHR